MMHKDFQYKFAFCFVLISIFTLSSCKESNSPLQSPKTEASIMSAVPLVKENVRPEVELSLMKLIDALKAKDLTLYARNIPENFQFRRAGMNSASPLKVNRKKITGTTTGAMSNSAQNIGPSSGRNTPCPRRPAI